MNSLKNMLKPGHEKDDQALYGSGNKTGTSGNNNPENDTLYETKDTKPPKEHGILRQILNPGGEKYDEAAYGANATTNPRASENAVERAPDMFDRRYEEGGEGYQQGSQGLSSTGTSSGVPGQQSHLGRDTALAGGAGTAAYEAEKHHGHHGHHHDTTGTSSSTTTGYPTSASDSAPGYSNTGSSNIAPGSGMTQPGQTDTGHHYGRDTAAAGGLAGAGYEAERLRKGEYNSSSGLPSDTTNFSHPRGTANDRELPGDLGANDPRRGSGATGIQSGSTSNTGDRSHLGRDAALGAGAAGLAAEGMHHHGHDSALPDRTRDNYGSTGGPLSSGMSSGAQHGNVGRDAAALGTAGALGDKATHHHNDGFSHADHHEFRGPNLDPSGNHVGFASGPHVTDTANRLDPHISSGGLATGAAGLGAGESARHHHHHHNQPTNTSYDDQRAVPQSGHHYGRDAAGAAGLGAAGAGAYEGLHNSRAGPKESDPASSTIGPHSSNVMNVLDPRVQPDPSKQKDPTPAHNNETMNRMDPRVNSQNAPMQAAYPNENLDNKHHYDRDAAMVGGGAATAGAAGHEFSKKDAERQEKEMIKEEKAERKAEQKAAHHHDKDEKKSGGILSGLLHRDHKKHDDTTSGNDRRLHEDHDYEGATQPDYIATHPERLQQGGHSDLQSAGGQAEQMDNYNASHHHNKLHKDPPANVQRELEEKARQEGNVGNSGTSESTTTGYPTSASDATR